MKTCFAFLIVLIFISCKKDNAYSYSGKASFHLNGVKQEFKFCRGTYSVYDKNKFEMSINLFKDGLDLNETLFFNNVSNIELPQRFKSRLVESQLYSNFFRVREFDVVCETYIILEKDSLTNFIKVNTQNLPKISGTFSATFVTELPISKCFPNTPDTLRITNGTFETKVYK